jgi:hypothetical protein
MSTLPRHQSLLFPSLCSKLPRDRRLEVLDIGPAFPETVEFFSSFRCRLHFADLYSEPLVLQGSSHLDAEALQGAFRDCLALTAETRFDLVLLWDFPNYIDDKALRAFDAVLRRTCVPEPLAMALPCALPIPACATSGMASTSRTCSLCVSRVRRRCGSTRIPRPS